MSDPGPLAEAEAWLRQQSERGLGSRARLRLFAVTLWSSFIGAVVMLLVALAVLPSEVTAHAGLGGLSAGFFLCWVLAAIPASIAVLLTHPGIRPPLLRGREAPHERR